MKNLLVVTSLLVSIFVTASISFAGEYVDYNVGKICYVQSNLIYPCDTWYSVAGTHNGWISWDKNQWDVNMMHADAVVALLTGKDVIVRIDTSDNSEYYDKTMIIRIQR